MHVPDTKRKNKVAQCRGEDIDAAIDEDNQEGMKLANASGEPGIVSRAAQPKFFMWLPKDLTPLGDKPTLTSTLKLKRSVVNKMYQDIIDAKYDELINGK